jgi:hypothetical protein
MSDIAFEITIHNLERRGRLINILVSYLGGLGLTFRLGDLLS